MAKPVKAQSESEASDKKKYQWCDELSSPQKALGLKFFNYEEAQDTDQKDNFSDQELSDSYELVNPKKDQFSKTHNNLQTQKLADSEKSEEEILMPAPKTKKHQPG